MSAVPPLLPPLLCVEPWCDAIVDALYEVFDRDFRQTKPILDGQEIHYYSKTRPDGRETIFWHLITTEDATRSARNPDPSRAARLAWVRFLIEHSTENGVLLWDLLEHDGAVKTYIWFVSGDFLLIFKKLKDGRRRLLTSFCIKYERYKSGLEKKYKKRIQN